MNATGSRKLPADAPTGFIKRRWEKLVVSDTGLDRRQYELCALSELKNALRSGDIWVQGSRQFKDFDTYLVPTQAFTVQRQTDALRLSVDTDCDTYLRERLSLLDEQLATVNRLAGTKALPDALITAAGLKITPQQTVVPDTAQALIDQVRISAHRGQPFRLMVDGIST